MEKNSQNMDFSNYYIAMTLKVCQPPQKNEENSIIERLHLTMGDMLCLATFEGKKWWFELEYTC